jgi:hypothetical protein
MLRTFFRAIAWRLGSRTGMLLWALGASVLAALFGVHR